ncbi:hypothetical protein QF028_006148 [Neobacillus sp. B4I6]
MRDYVKKVEQKRKIFLQLGIYCFPSDESDKQQLYIETRIFERDRHQNFFMNVYFVTTDVHFAEVIKYDANQGSKTDYHELISGPIGAVKINPGTLHWILPSALNACMRKETSSTSVCSM